MCSSLPRIRVDHESDIAPMFRNYYMPSQDLMKERADGKLFSIFKSDPIFSIVPLFLQL